jgi:hypothetical protein
MSDWTPATTRLVELLGRTARGPRREGVYALWLVVRAAEDGLLDPPMTPKLRVRHLEGLRHRLSTLTLPAQVRRAVTAALAQLGDGTPDGPATALHQLTAPAREALGPEVADAVATAARAARGTK